MCVDMYIDGMYVDVDGMYMSRRQHPLLFLSFSLNFFLLLTLSAGFGNFCRSITSVIYPTPPFQKKVLQGCVYAFAFWVVYVGEGEEGEGGRGRRREEEGGGRKREGSLP